MNRSTLAILMLCGAVVAAVFAALRTPGCISRRLPSELESVLPGSADVVVPLRLEPGSIDSKLDAALELLGRIEEAQSMRTAVSKDGQGVSASQGPGRSHEDHTPDEAAAGTSALWVSVLDPAIAQALVERGMTPFDKGVAAHVTKAGAELRSIELTYKQVMDPLGEALAAGEMKFDAYTPLRISYGSERDSKRRSTISHLEAALDDF
jgi:hypothetical protein